MIMGCHDLTIFNPRSKNAKRWRKKLNREFRRLSKHENPKIVLEHPHTTDSIRTWSAAWNGLKNELPAVKIFASAGRYYDDEGVRSELDSVLEETKNVDTIDFVVRT